MRLRVRMRVRLSDRVKDRVMVKGRVQARVKSMGVRVRFGLCAAFIPDPPPQLLPLF